MIKKYKHKFGLFHGRFQHIQLGHQRIIDKMLLECQEAILLIGECQSYGSERNPFNILDRIDLIKRIYGNNKRLKIGFFPDLHDVPKTEKEYSEWGDWMSLMAETKQNWNGYTKIIRLNLKKLTAMT